MPGEKFHRCLTARALVCAGVPDAASFDLDCCCWPDDYWGPRSAEAEPYMYFTDGIQFHYPPHTPVEEFYRYWAQGENGLRMVHLRPNDNLRHVESGMRFYIEKAIGLLRLGERKEAWKYLGCLLHFIEDSLFGLHALEGADGTDLFVLDRLSGREVAKHLAKLPFDESFFTFAAAPRILSDSVDEAVSLLYARYVRDGASSRRALFDLAADFLYGASRKTPRENVKTMFLNALSLATDAVATVFAIPEDRAPSVPERRLADFAPFVYPIGGSGGFALRRYEERGNGIAFGVNSEAVLLYAIPRGVYRRFSADVRLEDAGPLTLELVTGGVCAEKFELAGGVVLPVRLDGPGGETGFRVFSRQPRGRVVIENGVFLK